MDSRLDPSALYRDGTWVGRISGTDADDSRDDDRCDVGTFINSNFWSRLDYGHDDDRVDDQRSSHLLALDQSATVHGRARGGQFCQRFGWPLDVGYVGIVGYGALSFERT